MVSASSARVLPRKSGSARCFPTCRSGKATSSAVRPPAEAASAIRWSGVRPAGCTTVGTDMVRGGAEIGHYALDEAAPKAARETTRGQRLGWLATDPEQVAADYRAGKIDKLDVV